jgi:hypothetical protein
VERRGDRAHLHLQHGHPPYHQHPHYPTLSHQLPSQHSSLTSLRTAPHSRSPTSSPHATSAHARIRPTQHRNHTHASPHTPINPPPSIFNYFPNSPIRSTACLLASSSSDNCAAGRWFDPHKLPLPRRQRVTETLALAEKATDLVTRRILSNFGWVGCAFCHFGDLFGGDGRWGGRR